MTADNPNEQTNTNESPRQAGDKTRSELGMKQGVGIFTLVSLAVFCYSLATSKWWVGGLLYLGAIIALSYFYFQLEPDEREWLAERGLIFVGLLVSGILLAGVVFWLVTNYYWSPPEQVVENRPLQTAVPQVTLLFNYNRYIAADGQPVRVSVEGYNTTTESVELNIGVLRPDHVLFEAAPLTTTLPILLKLPAGGKASRSFTLLNERTFTEAQKDDKLFVCTQEATGSESCVPDQDDFDLPILIEGTQGWRIRTFINSGVSESGPLFFLVAVLVPGLVAFLQQYLYLDKHAREARAEKALKIERWVTQFRNYLNAGELNDAVRVLGWLQDEKPNEEEREHIQVAEKLVKMARLSAQSQTIVADTKDWPDECIMAYVVAQKELKKQRKELDLNKQNAQEIDHAKENEWNAVFNSLNKARYSLPLDEARPKIYDQFRDVEKTSVPATPLQLSNQFDPEPSPAAQDTKTKEKDARELNMWTPFAGDKAEDETYDLFVKDAFYPHRLFKELDDRTKGKRIKDSCIIYGPSGSGRTALAMALSSTRFRSKKPVLALYLPGRHSLREIEALLMMRLLDIIKDNPIHLSRLVSVERKLLCQLLATNLGIETSRVALIPARDKIDEPGWKKDLRPTEDQKLNWPSMAKTQLQLLDRTLEELPHTIRLNRTVAGWPGAISALAKALGLDETILIVDAGKDDDEVKWVKDEIWLNLRRWQALGLRVIVFLPAKEVGGFPAEDGVVLLKQLKWERSDIANFAKWRYQRLPRSRSKSVLPINHFNNDESILEDLITRSKDPLEPDTKKLNPRHFMELWRDVFAETDPETGRNRAETNRSIVLDREEYDKRIKRCP